MCRRIRGGGARRQRVGVGGGGLESGACHILKGQRRVYLRSHRKASSKSAEDDAIFTAACVSTLATWESCHDNEFLMELPASSQAERGCTSWGFRTNSNSLTKRKLNTGGISLNQIGGPSFIYIMCLLQPTRRGQSTYSFHLVPFNQTHIEDRH